jgi:hypothetical protein
MDERRGTRLGRAPQQLERVAAIVIIGVVRRARVDCLSA